MTLRGVPPGVAASNSEKPSAPLTSNAKKETDLCKPMQILMLFMQRIIPILHQSELTI